MSYFWQVQPLHTFIVETLLKKGGASTDTELFSNLQKANTHISVRELNKTLMQLELEGVIHVSNLTKNKRRVELRTILQ